MAAVFFIKASYKVKSECGKFEIAYSDVSGVEVYWWSCWVKCWLGTVSNFFQAKKLARTVAKREVVFPELCRVVESDCGKYSITALEDGSFCCRDLFRQTILGTVCTWDLAVSLTEGV